MPQQQRKIAFILGAGASLGAGAYATVEAGGHVAIPTQTTFWKTFLRFCRSKKSKQRIESFLFRYFLDYKRPPNRIPAKKRHQLLQAVDVEEVFTFISERAQAPATSPQLRTYAVQVWGDLINEIGNVFSRFQPNKSTRNIYRKLAAIARSHDTFVSFNYDTIFESSLPKTKKWCYVSVKDKADTLRIMKPHGSVNWQRKVSGGIRIKQNASPAIVVAPTHLKFVETRLGAGGNLQGYLDQADQIKQIWRSMEREMSRAKLLVFVGYSFPVADLYFSSVLRSVLAGRDRTPGIVLVNPDAVAIQSRLKARFALGKVVPYFDLKSFVGVSRKDLLAQFT